MWQGFFPIIFAPCECVDPISLEWLLEHGADPNAANNEGTSALDYVIGSYVRSPDLTACIDMLIASGARTRYAVPGVLELLCGRLDLVRAQLDADSSLVNRRFGELDFGTTGGRMLTLTGATLLHVAAEYRNVDAIDLLLRHGADVNAHASINAQRVGGQSAIFHAVTQADDGGVAAARLLIERGADLTRRVKLSGHYERPGRGRGVHAAGICAAVPGDAVGQGKNGGAAARERGRGVTPPPCAFDARDRCDHCGSREYDCRAYRWSDHRSHGHIDTGEPISGTPASIPRSTITTRGVL